MSGTLEIERRALGRSDAVLPRISLGCGNFGGVGSAPAFFGRGLNQDEAFGLMDAAWELGLHHFDTADAYGGGRSEAAIGAWIEARGVRPMITTKTFNPMQEGADHGLAPERIVRQLHSSLQRLGVESVDLYLAHDYDPDVPLDETMGAFEDLKSGGLIGAYGVSNFDSAQFDSALVAGEPSAIQNSHSLLDRGDEQGVLPTAEENGVAYLAFGPLAGGWLTGKYRRGEGYPSGSRMTQRPEPYLELATDGTFDALEALQAIATARGSSMAAVALGWLLCDDRVTQIVTGPGRPEHLTPVREALSHPLSETERARIEEVFEP
jgi:aryl-alcohol dehydrogenase-like predicted oxidoreductase